MPRQRPLLPTWALPVILGLQHQNPNPNPNQSPLAQVRKTTAKTSLP